MQSYRANFRIPYDQFIDALQATLSPAEFKQFSSTNEDEEFRVKTLSDILGHIPASEKQIKFLDALGYEKVRTFIQNEVELVKVLKRLKIEEREAFLKKLSHEHVRSLINNADQLIEVLELMPIAACRSFFKDVLGDQKTRNMDFNAAQLVRIARILAGTSAKLKAASRPDLVFEHWEFLQEIVGRERVRQLFCNSDCNDNFSDFINCLIIFSPKAFLEWFGFDKLKTLVLTPGNLARVLACSPLESYELFLSNLSITSCFADEDLHKVSKILLYEFKNTEAYEAFGRAVANIKKTLSLSTDQFLATLRAWKLSREQPSLSSMFLEALGSETVQSLILDTRQLIELWNYSPFHKNAILHILGPAKISALIPSKEHLAQVLSDVRQCEYNHKRFFKDLGCMQFGSDRIDDFFIDCALGNIAKQAVFYMTGDVLKQLWAGSRGLFDRITHDPPSFLNEVNLLRRYNSLCSFVNNQSNRSNAFRNKLITQFGEQAFSQQVERQLAEEKVASPYF